MTLVLEIEHLVGVAFAAPSQASVLPDWPPQPDRVFSALVAAWGARGARTEERRALEWLEAQPVPELSASGGFPRSAATVFVPPNDPETGRVGNRSIMPALRRRQPRRFPAFRPDDPVVFLIWRDLTVDNEMLAALNCLARDTPYVGHSASLTRCRFRVDPAVEPGARPRRRVYRGRLAELERAHQAGRRPNYGADVDVSTAKDEDRHPRSVFASRWLVLEHVGGTMPDLRAAALVGKALRNAVMSGYKRTVGEAAVPDSVSGHSADGAPIAKEHLAIVPMAFVGWQHADGRVLGFALVPPADGTLLDDPRFQDAMRSIATWNDTSGRRELNLRADGFDLVFSLAPDSDRRSLDPAPYVATARTWASCTPIVIDRHLKASGNAARDLEMCEAIARACRNIGLPSPSQIRNADTAQEELAIAVSKHSAFKEAPSAYPSGRAPSWTRWRLPTSVASRQLTHAVLQFDQPIRGPVILGAGRFAGLGLCRALDPEAR
jgi:CRISPR-associated protein Csb2